MIHKIKSIKNFGIFKNYNGSSLPDFTTFNLIYGWNYSGKTTLSRVFRCIEKSQIHSDYLSATFELSNQSDTYDNSFRLTPIIRVFNSDFVKDNLKWDNENIEPIFLLGEENIELQTQLSQKKADLLALEELQSLAIRNRQQKQSSIESALTERARLVGDSLSIRPFTRTHLTPIVETIKSNPQTLSDQEFQAIKIQATSTDQKPIIDTISFKVASLENLKSEIEEILHRQTASSNKIQKLLDDHDLSDWIETGKDIHKNKTQCEFCGGDLSTDLIEKLNAHFSTEYELLKTDISSCLQKLNESRIDISNLLPTDLAFYADIQNDYLTQKSNLENQVRSFNSILDSLENNVIAKQSSPFDRHEIIDFLDNSLALTSELADLNAVISQNNSRTQGFEAAKQVAIDKIKKHYASEFVIEKNYTTVQNELVQSKLKSKKELLPFHSKNK